MDRRTMTAVFLVVLVWYGWLMIFPPEVPEEVADGDVAEDQQPGTDSADTTPKPTGTGLAATHVDHSESELKICDADFVWNSDAGVGPITLDSHRDAMQVTPLYSWLYHQVVGPRGESWHPYGAESGPAFALSPLARVLAPGSGDLQGPLVSMERVDDATLGFEGRTEDGVLVTQKIEKWTGEDGGCALDVTVDWTNQGSSAVPVWVAAHDTLDTAGWGSRYDNIRGVWVMFGDDVENATDYEAMAAEGGLATEYTEPMVWFGLADRYFTALAMPTAGAENAQVTYTARGEGETALQGASVVLNSALQPGQTHSATFRLVAGPKDHDFLAAVDPRLTDVIQLGWFSFFASPLQWLLNTYQGFVINWGIAIILLTFTVKAVFFPLSQRAFTSAQAMQAIQPEMARIREEYADDSERMNRELMQLFQDNNVNPLGGCLPMLLQMPVFFALYSVLLSSTDLYQASFLYLQDLSSPDPYGVLPLMVVGVMSAQQYFMSPTTKPEPGSQQEMQMRMMRMMPFVFGVLNFTFPSGVVLYIFVNVSLSVLQQWVIRRTYQPPATAGAAG